MSPTKKNELWRAVIDGIQVVSAAGVMGLLVVIGGYKEKIDRVVADTARIEINNSQEHDQIKKCMIRIGSELTQYTNKNFDYLP